MPKRLLLGLGVFLALAGVALSALFLIHRPGSSSSETKAERPSEAERAGAEHRFGELSYNQLLVAIRRHKVVKAELDPRGLNVILTFRDKSQATAGYPPSDQELVDRLIGSGAEVTVDGDGPSAGRMSPLLQGFLILFVASIFIALAVTAIRTSRGGGGVMSLRRGVKLSDEERPAIGFDDVAGCDEVVAEVREYLDFLRAPERFKAVGAQLPAGLLLYGPPGTGKTLIAKALAGEAEIPFFAASGSDFVEKYVGVGSSRIRELFGRALKSPDGAVVFIDELDAVGKRRSEDGLLGNDEREQTLNELLVQLDGFQSERRLICVAATNRLDTIDPALLRPGRFSRQIHVDLPAEAGRGEILTLHAAGKPLAASVDLARLARMTAGSSGADLANMINEAAIMAARDGRLEISQSDLEEGHLRSLAGPEKIGITYSAEERRIIAFHEAGHVLCAELCPSHEKAERATIKPRGRAAGLAVYGRTDRFLHSTDYLHEQLICALGGRAAERVIFQTVSSGAANDLQQANAIARRAVEELGLSPRAGQLTGEGGRGQLAESTRGVHDQEVERLVAEAYREAIDLLESHRVQLERLAAALLSSEQLDRLEILAAIGEATERRERSGRPDLEPKPEAVLGRSRQAVETDIRRPERPTEGPLSRLRQRLRRRRPAGTP
jgi:cell division protease FtsH